MKAAIIIFPGTNCERETYEACKFFGWETEYIWHNQKDLNHFNIIILPGGFSYGDYIRSGRLAKFSPVMASIKNFINEKRGFVLGICNGFQTLCEAGILPGILTENYNNKFICDEVNINFFGTELTIPIAHKEGRYIINGNNDLKDFHIIKYRNNPNGSMFDIAGIYDKQRKILALMPHPERCIFNETGKTDGRKIFEFIQKELKN